MVQIEDLIAPGNGKHGIKREEEEQLGKRSAHTRRKQLLRKQKMAS